MHPPNERRSRSSDVQPYVINGLLATEDRYFYYHFGFNPIRIIEAAIVDLHSHRLSQGASTLTQQLARTFIDHHARSFHRKFRELAIALVLEMRLTKKEILERYINDVPMGEYEGSPIYGLPLAAHYFFNKDLRVGLAGRGGDADRNDPGADARRSATASGRVRACGAIRCSPSCGMRA